MSGLSRVKAGTQPVSTAAIVASLVLFVIIGAQAARSSNATSFDIWDIPIGSPVNSVPDKKLGEIACGTNGGPPSAPLRSLSSFEKCPIDDAGLREIYFTYDDELEYRARALELQNEKALFSGTTIGGHPVIVSILVDGEGIIRGIRIVNDTRGTIRDRRRAAALGDLLKSRFGDGWECDRVAPGAGEVPIAGLYINELCTKSDPAAGDLTLAVRYFRKKGHRSFDPRTGLPVKGAFESYVYFELLKRPSSVTPKGSAAPVPQ